MSLSRRKSLKSLFSIVKLDRSRRLTRSTDDWVNLFWADSCENPPDNVAPLNEERFITKYETACCVPDNCVISFRILVNVSFVTEPMLFNALHSSSLSCLHACQNEYNGVNLKVVFVIPTINGVIFKMPVCSFQDCVCKFQAICFLFQKHVWNFITMFAILKFCACSLQT